MTIKATLLLFALVALTACSNEPRAGVATAQSPGHSATTAGASGTPNAPRFAACLRDRGIEVADPPPGGQVEISTKDDKTRAALRACAEFAPPGRSQEPSFDAAASRAYAACIRGKGFPDFPDPDQNGPRIPKKLVRDDRFIQADRECAQHLNKNKGSKR